MDGRLSDPIGLLKPLIILMHSSFWVYVSEVISMINPGTWRLLADLVASMCSPACAITKCVSSFSFSPNSLLTVPQAVFIMISEGHVVMGLPVYSYSLHDSTYSTPGKWPAFHQYPDFIAS